MNLHIIFLLVIMFSISCGERTIKEKDNFSWGEIPNQLKDSLIYMEKSGHIPNSVSGVAAKEPENYSKLVWILNNSKTEYLEKTVL